MTPLCYINHSNGLAFHTSCKRSLSEVTWLNCHKPLHLCSSFLFNLSFYCMLVLLRYSLPTVGVLKVCCIKLSVTFTALDLYILLLLNTCIVKKRSLKLALGQP